MSMMKRKFEEARDRTLYFVRVSDGDSYWPERVCASRKTLLQDLRSGEIKNEVEILECNPVEGTCRDVTEDFRDWAREGDPLTETPAARARIYDAQPHAAE